MTRLNSVFIDGIIVGIAFSAAVFHTATGLYPMAALCVAFGVLWGIRSRRGSVSRPATELKEAR